MMVVSVTELVLVVKMGYFTTSICLPSEKKYVIGYFYDIGGCEDDVVILMVIAVVVVVLIVAVLLMVEVVVVVVDAVEVVMFVTRIVYYQY